jgi:hypothetical protein
MQPGICLYGCESLNAVQLGHHQIEQNEIEWAIFECEHRLAPVSGGHYVGVAGQMQEVRKQLTVLSGIINNQDRVMAIHSAAPEYVSPGTMHFTALSTNTGSVHDGITIILHPSSYKVAELNASRSLLKPE